MTSSPNRQTREIKAAVVRKKGGPFRIETLALEEPRADEVLIRIVASNEQGVAAILAADLILHRRQRNLDAAQ